MEAVNRPAIRLMGALIVLLGIWGGLVPFLGPAINFGSGPSWAWSESHTTLHVVPGIAAVLAGTTLLVGRRGSLPVLASVLAIAGGAWFIVGPSLHQIWASGSTTASHSMPASGGKMSGSGMGSSHMSGSSRGTSSASSSSGGMAMGMGSSGSGSTKGALEAVAYHYGTGAAIAVLASVSLGLLLAAPAAAVAGAPADEARRRRLRVPIDRPAQV